MIRNLYTGLYKWKN